MGSQRNGRFRPLPSRSAGLIRETLYPLLKGLKVAVHSLQILAQERIGEHSIYWERDMKLKNKEREFLSTFVAVAQRLLGSPTVSKRNGKVTRKRRSKTDAIKLRRRIRAARKRKGPVSKIADQLGATPAYICQIGK
jgi:hypothetical protein